MFGKKAVSVACWQRVLLVFRKTSACVSFADSESLLARGEFREEFATPWIHELVARTLQHEIAKCFKMGIDMHWIECLHVVLHVYFSQLAWLCGALTSTQCTSARGTLYDARCHSSVWIGRVAVPSSHSQQQLPGTRQRGEGKYLATTFTYITSATSLSGNALVRYTCM